jgi:pimeloyl-ACP methyl ester carboxylesterase
VDLQAALQRLTCPVLLLQGDRAYRGVVSDEDVERAMGLLADGVHVRLEGAGHDLGLSTWEVAPLLRALVGFLESL